ncbi:MAG: mycothiol transferase [Frankia sp.]
MDSADLLVDAFDRVRDVVAEVVEGLTPEQLSCRVDQGANSIAWLVWHLTRIQDDHVAEVAGIEQQWTAGGWYERFGLPFNRRATGFGHRPDDVAAVRVESGALLTDYHDAVHDQTVRHLGSLVESGLDRVVDRSWDPPVTLGTRLISVVSDDMQHAGQAAYVRGAVRRR